MKNIYVLSLASQNLQGIIKIEKHHFLDSMMGKNIQSKMKVKNFLSSKNVSGKSLIKVSDLHPIRNLSRQYKGTDRW